MKLLKHIKNLFILNKNITRWYFQIRKLNWDVDIIDGHIDEDNAKWYGAMSGTLSDWQAYDRDSELKKISIEFKATNPSNPPSEVRKQTQDYQIGRHSEKSFHFYRWRHDSWTLQVMSDVEHKVVHGRSFDEVIAKYNGTMAPAMYRNANGEQL